MDDVIFAGSASRAARSHAEVVLTIDNASGDAPGRFAADPVLEVARRIDRGEGSTYRINGRESRARDVQILFADASSGANSPALVRQGQISELIAAKPQNRRRILEEAAGVSGLHGRRHEAELRIAAVVANLERLDAVTRELDMSLARLRKEARQAERYKTVAAEIRALETSLAESRWREARHAVAALELSTAEAQAAAESSALDAAAAIKRVLDADARVGPARQAAALATAKLNEALVARDRLDRDRQRADADIEALDSELGRLKREGERANAWAAEAHAGLQRLAEAAEALNTRRQAAEQALAGLETAAVEADADWRAAETGVEEAATAFASAKIQRQSVESRLADAVARGRRMAEALERARADVAALEGVSAGLAVAASEAATGAVRLAEAREARAHAEMAWTAARERESAVRLERRAAEDALASCLTESQALARLAAGEAADGFTPVLDSVAPAAGFEAALAAAFGADLDAALDPAAPAFWAGAGARAPEWPKGARPLADHVRVPPALAARLALTALVDASQGDRLQRRLPPGARLVSKAGDLWRWDGYTQRAGASRPAEARLAQRARLAVLQAEISRLKPNHEAAQAAHGQAATNLADAEERLRAARLAEGQADMAAELERQTLAAAHRTEEERQARRSQTQARIAQLEGEAAEAAEAAATAEADRQRLVDGSGLEGRLNAARGAAHAAREKALSARMELEAEHREGAAAANRLSAIAAEQADWEARRIRARAQFEELAAARQAVEARLEIAKARPETLERERLVAQQAFIDAEVARDLAAQALTEAESRRTIADQASRAVESLASAARETIAGLAGRLEAARERLAEHANGLASARQTSVAALEALAEDASSQPHDPGVAEARLTALRRERDGIGPVNLRAAEDLGALTTRADSLAHERADLDGALHRLRRGVTELNAEGRQRLLAAFDGIHTHFRDLFTTLFAGGRAELRLIDAEDPLEAGLEIFACPPGKRLTAMSLMSGGEQALTAMALIFAVFLSNPAPVCVLDEADAPLDDANVEKFCNLLAAMRVRTSTRFLVITHNPLTMSRMDRLYGVTMSEPGVSQLVSVDLHEARAMVDS
jgi:chromosome segregation protein